MEISIAKNIKQLEGKPTSAWLELMDQWRKISVDNDEMEEMLRKLESCKVLYKKNKNGHFVLYDIYNENEVNSYEGEFSTLPLNSTYEGCESWEGGTEFANVIDSTNDPKIYKMSWINLYEFVVRIVTGDLNYSARYCCTDGYVYDPNNDAAVQVMCTARFVGGHIMRGKRNIWPRQNTIVYLLPICGGHNTSGDHGTGYYMKLFQPHIAVKLKFFA